MASEFVLIGDAAIRRSAITSVALVRSGMLHPMSPEGPDEITAVRVCTVAEEFKFRLGECRPATFDDALLFARGTLAEAMKGA